MQLLAWEILNFLTGRRGNMPVTGWLCSCLVPMYLPQRPVLADDCSFSFLWRPQYQEWAHGQTHLHSPESSWIVTTLRTYERLNWREWMLYWVVILERGYWARWTFDLSSMAFLMISILINCWNLITGHILFRSLHLTQASSPGPAAGIGLPVIYDGSGSYNKCCISTEELEA